MKCEFEAYLRDAVNQLVFWKSLPKYEFERRFDVLLAPFLNDILSACLGGEVAVVAPEFPLKHENTNHTDNADYLCALTGAEGKVTWILLELKTASESVSSDQIEMYRRNRDKGFARLCDEVGLVAKASGAKEKYANLIALLPQGPVSDELQVVFLAPAQALVPPDFKHITFEQAFAITPSKYPEVWQCLREALAGVLS